jgi:fluoroquinolone transport system permease protein
MESKSNLLTLMKWDFKLQKAYKISIIYGLVMILYIILLKAIPMNDNTPLLIMLIFTDPSLLGFMFIGALVYFEKSENVLTALSATPLKLDTYLKSKALTFGIMSLYTSVIIVLFVKWIDANYLLLSVGVFLTSIAFTLFGFAIASKFNNFNEFLMTAILYNFVFLVPILQYLSIIDSFLIYFIPTQGTILLIQGSFGGGSIESWQIAYSILYLILFCILTFYWAKYAYRKNIIMHGGEAKQ